MEQPGRSGTRRPQDRDPGPTNRNMFAALIADRDGRRDTARGRARALLDRRRHTAQLRFLLKTSRCGISPGSLGLGLGWRLPTPFSTGFGTKSIRCPTRSDGILAFARPAPGKRRLDPMGKAVRSHRARLPRDFLAPVEQGRRGDRPDPVTRRKRLFLPGIDLDQTNHRPKPWRHHSARAAPACPEIDEHRLCAAQPRTLICDDPPPEWREAAESWSACPARRLGRPHCSPNRNNMVHFISIIAAAC